MISGSQVYQVARSVARGDGDWAEVPRCVREAIVLSLSSPHIAAGASVSRGSEGTAARPSASAPTPAAGLPPVLSEGVIQRSVQTFEDGAWIRDQAVRSYAQFHNSIESLHTGMRGQLRALWRTAMQLSPRILDDVRRQYKLGLADTIPDGVPLRAPEAERLVRQAAVLDELVEDLQRVRDTSVRFAAHWLTEREMMAMGADPAYLRPEAIDREVSRRSRSTRTDGRRRRSTSVSRRRRSSLSARGRGAPARASPAGPSTDPLCSPRSASRHSRRSSRQQHAASDTDEVGYDSGSDAGGAQPVSRDDPQLRELRRQYVARLAELSQKQRRGGDRERKGGGGNTSERPSSSARRSRRHSSSAQRSRRHDHHRRHRNRSSASNSGRRAASVYSHN